MSSAVLLPSPILVAPPTGTSTLPIVEVKRKDVETKGKRVRLRKGPARDVADCSFGPYKEKLSIDAWKLFHAAKKTELTTTFTTAMVDRRAMLFAAEHDNLFIWNTNNLRKIDRSVFALEDFSQSGIAGRFGEAAAYLTMLHWGYVYWDRIAVLWERAAAQSGMNHQEMVRAAKVIAGKVATGRPDLEPDFAFEKDSGDVALMEAKGSFVHPVTDKPTVKDDLRQALKQLAAWSKMLTPTPKKRFGIGTYFREQSDTTGDESLIIYVDPPGQRDDNIRPIEFPAAWIRRGNYGAWLLGMGFSEVGNALRSGREYAPLGQSLPVINIRGREFALTFHAAIAKRNGKRRFPLVQPWIGPWLDDPFLDWRILRHMGLTAIAVLGIEVDVLIAIQDAILSSSNEPLLKLRATETVAEQSLADGFAGSIMPDGTMMGQIDPELLTDARLQAFKL